MAENVKGKLLKDLPEAKTAGSAAILVIEEGDETRKISFEALSALLKETWNADSLTFRRMLTASDNLDNITDTGIYYYETTSVPKNCPYQNAGIVEVLAATKNIALQRITRIGAGGQSAFRAKTAGGWHTTYEHMVGPGNSGMMVQSGTVTITPKANEMTSKAVKFPNAFSGTPNVVATPKTTGKAVQLVSVGGVESTGFNMYVLRENTTDTTIDWIAVGAPVG